jgi:hypothetical protein
MKTWIVVLAGLVGCGGSASPPDAPVGATPDGMENIVDAPPGPAPDAGAAPAASDPEDLPPPDGDPSVDVRAVHITDGAEVVVAIDVHGSWPPSTDFYSWYCMIELYAPGSATPAVTATLQRHDGNLSTIVTGAPPTSVTVDENATGPTFTFAQPPAKWDRFRVEAGVQKTNPGNRVVDEVETKAGEPIPFP